jgi:hypothetical protein
MNELCFEAGEAYAVLLALTPTTADGATAALLYVAQHENKLAPWLDNWGESFRAATCRHRASRSACIVLSARANPAVEYRLHRVWLRFAAALSARKPPGVYLAAAEGFRHLTGILIIERQTKCERRLLGRATPTPTRFHRPQQSRGKINKSRPDVSYATLYREKSCFDFHVPDRSIVGTE